MLVKAAKELPDVQFMIAGNGTIDIECCNIQRLGFVSGRLLQTLIKNAEFVVSPSVCTETFGISNGEAIKLGVPVIATNLGAFPEAVFDGVNGRIVEAGDARALAKLVSELWNKIFELDRIRDGCRRSNQMTIDQYTETIKVIYGA